MVQRIKEERKLTYKLQRPYIEKVEEIIGKLLFDSANIKHTEKII